ncbi:MAG TPA: hypothetical protein VGH04_06805, partial [Gemmatimonadaceae bacterium]
MTGEGVVLPILEPFPSWPTSLFPQQTTEPSSRRIAQRCAAPPVIDATLSPWLTESSCAKLAVRASKACVQQYAVPPSATAQLASGDKLVNGAVFETNADPPGGPKQETL